MPQQLLTDIAIRALKPGDRYTDYWDTKTHGFGIRIGARTKTFIAKHKNRWHTLGSYPELSLADARIKAKQVMVAPPAADSPLTVQQAYKLFLSMHCANIRLRTKTAYENTLTRHFLGKWKNKKLAEVTTDQVVSVVMNLTDRPSEASHAFAVVRTFFAWAVSMRYIPLSPLYGVKAPRQNGPRSRVLTDEELKRVWKAADELDGSFGMIVKLAILTGQRRGEIAALDHAWIRLDTVSLPATITKNKREHEFPLSASARALLPSEGKGHVFPARGKPDQPFNGWSKGKSELDKKCGVTNWTLHDIRRTVATKLSALGVALPVVERLLNHVSGSFGGIVSVHSFMPEMRAAVEKWEAHLSELVAR